jgi:hypothetical protein
MASAMQHAVPPRIAAFLLFTGGLTLLPLACAAGEGSGIVGSTTTGHTSTSGSLSGVGGAGGSTSGTAGSAFGGAGGSFGGAGGSFGGAGGSFSGAGGALGCDNNPSGCNGCTACANAGPCAAEWASCTSTPGCVSFMNCQNQCAGDFCCIDNCTTLYLNGSTAFYAYTSGCLCQTCFNDCLGKSGC